jgi:hypothetical protein
MQPGRTFLAAIPAYFSGMRALPALLALAAAPAAFAEKTHFTYLWHLEQPIYWPDDAGGRYERAWQSIVRKDAGAAHPENDLRNIFGLDDRVAAYQYRPRDTVSAISWAQEAGAQVSFSGGLIANIQSFAEAGGQLGYSTTWSSPWRQARGWSTGGAVGVPRMDIVVFPFHHALMPLIDESAMRKELALYKQVYPEAWGTAPAVSKGFFPSEMAFSTRMIPLLAEAGIQWSFVSSEKVSRACSDFPVVLGSGGVQCDPPNRADQLNPAAGFYDRMSISRGCGPAEAIPFGHQPHRAQYVNPATGAVSEIVVVPCSQSLGWLDGYAPLGIDNLNRIEARNDPNRPMLVVLAHDGDNAWGGGYSYYMEAVPNFVSAASGAGYVPTVVQRYLANHPVPAGDVIHVEDGAWVNADGDFGAPQFLNWNWPPVNAQGQIDIANGWAEDIRNWAVITAAQNFVDLAEQADADRGLSARPAHMLRPQAGTRASERAWHYFLGSLNSGYMYYGTALDMEVKPTVACNEAIAQANLATAGAADRTAPTVWIPQRHPWNPGAVNFGPQHGYQQKSYGPDFIVWTFVHDTAGLQSVQLKWRVDADGSNPLATTENETYAGGAGVGAWQTAAMTLRDFPAGNFFNSGSINFFEMPTAIAKQAYATIAGQSGKLIDYYVEATDALGNVKRSPIQHVYVGTGTGQGPGGGGGGGSSAFAMNGQLDASAVALGTNGGRTLWAALSGTTLYVATNDAGEGDDVFVAVADAPAGAMRATWWAKAGQAAQWKAFLADENDNGWSGWFDSAGNVTTGFGAATATGGNGGVLEGTIDLSQLFGTMPERVSLAAVAYGNANAGPLRSSQQVPASLNGNGSLEAGEFLTIDLCALSSAGCCRADLSGDGMVNGADLGSVLAAWGTANAAADLNGDGTVNGADLGELLSAWGTCG